ncbi:hypothetical protein A2875_02155 [Candidatus Gottesmanbacteria bacterium RIFCSPHIGHO2_01_FULL_46_14]|uniref:50S ribosomal protein L29 n=1 Tax=Candidatus Gottesmanbacteria bacterium RIFCSPHIGHO2_01_FULL_46_14 TaxID=1798380 RepID=A0A1F5ZT13_9BACT|nr:MAG: hypothetical protein A2875_02155 [Candidatus Gottesmanbacteria bacterium RIFCSPHIGHO2_01_FULL_46_14]
MKKNEKKSLLEKSIPQLQKLEGDLNREIEVLRVKRFTEQNKNTRSIGALRNKRAVIGSMIRQKELGGAV